MYSGREIERRGRGVQDEKGYISPGKFYGQGAELCALLRQYDSLRGSGRDRGRLLFMMAQREGGGKERKGEGEFPR